MKKINKLLFLISSLIFIYTVSLLILNISKGFDITDESHYILAAAHPNDIFSTVVHAGYYTNLLYALANYNLSFFRLFGILLLIGIAIWFSIVVFKYISKKFTLSFDLWDRLLFIIPISIGSLSYYRSWLITPSYNWLALISVILVLTFLLRVVNNKDINYNRYLTVDYFLLSFSLSLAFMAKPTTALVLVIISILFLIYEFKNINFKKALPSVIILTIIIVIAHIVILDGSFSSYYDRLTEGMERSALMGGGHTLDSRYRDMMQLIKKFFFEDFYFHKINNIYIYGMIFIVLILFILRNEINSLKIYSVLLFLVLIVYAYFMFNHDIEQNYRLMWIRSIELLFLNLILVGISILFVDKKMEFLTQIIKIIPLLFIIILSSFAYRFGSNTQIIHTMSGSIIFLVTSIIILNIVLDNKLNIRIFTSLSGLIMSIFIVCLIYHAYENPYRLITNIKGQNKKVELLGGLKVDQITKKYIEDLQQIALNNKENDKKISLIDMTGGSPGANVILDAEFFGAQWLLGAYPGSNQLVYRILKPYKNTDQLKSSWILVSPKGKRKLDLNILNKIGLDFPANYKRIGTVKTAHRNELQELWKPISTLK